MLISTSLFGLMLLSSVPLTTFAARGPAALQQGAPGDRAKTGRRINHVSEGSGSVNDRSGSALQTNGQRTEYPRASVAGLRSEVYDGTSNRGLVNNNAAYTNNNIIGSFIGGDGMKEEHNREQHNPIHRISTNDRSQRKLIGNYDSSVNTFTSITPTRSIAGTQPTLFLRTPGYSRTSRNLQHVAQPSGGSRPDTRLLPAPGHGPHSPTPLDLPRTSFSCQGRGHGYYADTEADCQVFHVCVLEGGQHSFMCPNGTVFNQQVLVCDWWFKSECSRAPQLYNKGNQKPEEDLKNGNTLSTHSHPRGVSSKGIKPIAAPDVTSSIKLFELSVGDVGQQTPYSRSARRLESIHSSNEGVQDNAIQGNVIPGNKIQGNFDKNSSFESVNTEFMNEQKGNNNFESSPLNNSSESEILFFSELDGIVSDVGIDSDGEIFFISDDIAKDNSLVINTLHSGATGEAKDNSLVIDTLHSGATGEAKDNSLVIDTLHSGATGEAKDNSLVIDTLHSGATGEAFQQNREPSSAAQGTSKTSLFKERGITGFVPSYAFPLMAKNINLFSL